VATTDPDVIEELEKKNSDNEKKFSIFVNVISLLRDIYENKRRLASSSAIEEAL